MKNEEIRKIANELNKQGFYCCRCMDCKTCKMAEEIYNIPNGDLAMQYKKGLLTETKQES